MSPPKLTGLLPSSVLTTIVLFCLCLTVVDTEGFNSPLSPPQNCNKRDTLLRHGFEYRYAYNVHSLAGATVSPENSVGSDLSCAVFVRVPKKCEVEVHVRDCALKDGRPTVGLTQALNEEQLSSKLERYPMYMQLNEGNIVNGQIVVSTKDDLQVVNLKRAIASSLQHVVLKDKDNMQTTHQQYDIFGQCGASLSYAETGHTVSSFRDLTMCNLSHISEGQAALMASVKSLHGGYRYSPIHELMYPLDSTVHCSQTTAKSRLQTSTCHQQVTFSQFPNGGSQQGINVSQTLQLKEQSRLESKELNRSIRGRKLVSIVQEFEDKTPIVTSHEDLHDQMDQVLDAYLAQGGGQEVLPDNSALVFKTCVSMMRTADEESLSQEKIGVFACRESTFCDHTPKQGLKEGLFTDALLSCGTEACMKVLVDILTTDQMSEWGARSVLFNMGLFYCSPSSVTQRLFEYCTKEKGLQCWLPVSAMINRLHQQFPSNKEVISLVRSALVYLDRQLNEMADYGIKRRKDQAKFIANEQNIQNILQAINNIGKGSKDALESVDDLLVTLSSSLTNFIKNEHSSLTTSKIAVKAISILDKTSLVSGQLLEILQDEKHEVALRAAIFDVLVLLDEERVLSSLIEVYQRTQLDNMKTYITTKLSSILEGSEDNYDGQRQKLKALLGDNFPPDLGDNILSKSQHTRISRNVSIPLSSFNMAGYAVFNLLYTPSSNLFRSLTLTLGYTLGHSSTELLEMILDLEGFDTLTTLLNSQSKQDQDESIDVTMILNMLQKVIKDSAHAKKIEFVQYSAKVNKVLQTLYKLANIQKASFPRAYASFRLLGYEVGSLSSDSMLLMMKKLKGKGDPARLIMHTLRRGVHVALARASELMHFRHVLPTVGGVPFEFQTDFNVVSKFTGRVDLMAKENSNAKSTKINVLLDPSVSSSWTSELTLNFEGYSRIGLSTSARGEGSTSWNSIVKFQPGTPSQKQGHVLELVKGVEQTDFVFLNVESDTTLLRNSEKISMGGIESTFEKCLPDIYTKLLGHKTCISGATYQADPSPASLPFDMSSLFRLRGTLTKTDKNLNKVSLTATQNVLTSETEQPLGTLNTLTLTGKGEDLSRMMNFEFELNKRTNTAVIRGGIPDIGVTYYLEKTALHLPGASHRKIASIISKDGTALSSFVAEHRMTDSDLLSEPGMEVKEGKEQYVHLNVSLGALAFDVSYTDHMLNQDFQAVDVYLHYYCEPQLRLLYALHPRPQLAAGAGHTSTFSFHKRTHDSKTSLTETWHNYIKTYAYAPGHNITTDTALIADIKTADRITDIYWIKDDRMVDEVHMVAHASNVSDSQVFHYDMQMHVENKHKYIADFSGHVKGPRALPLADMTIHTDMKYKAHENFKHDSIGSFFGALGRVEDSLMKTVSSIYSSAKTKLLSLLSRRSSASIFPDATHESKGEFLHDSQPLNVQKGDLAFWRRPQWSLHMVTKLKMKPKFVKTVAGKKKSGMEVKWSTTTSLPQPGSLVFGSHGALNTGDSEQLQMFIDERIHGFTLNISAEQYNTKEVFHHHHNWSLVDTVNHGFDRAFNYRVRLEHYKSFDYDLELLSPRTNLTHQIHYSKVSPVEHRVRAFAKLHSIFPVAFDLLYHESSDLVKGNLKTHMNMTSSVMDAKLDLEKQGTHVGQHLSGDLQTQVHVSPLRGTRNVKLALNLAKGKPPSCQWMFTSSRGSSSLVQMQLMGPKKIEVSFQAQKDDSDMMIDPKLPAVSWAVALVPPSRLEHTILVPRRMLAATEYIMTAIRPKVAAAVRRAGETAAFNLQADVKDMILPFTNESMQDVLQQQLGRELHTDPASRKVKVYKLSLGALHAINELCRNHVIVQLLRNFHVHQLLSSTTAVGGGVISAWIQRPPSFVRQFAKGYLVKPLQAAQETGSFSFSTQLPFTMTGFNSLPQLTILEKEALAAVQRKWLGATSLTRDVAVILEGRRIKTFDGHVYAFEEPKRQQCTYLLGGDMRHGHFVMTWTKDALTVALPSSGVTLARDGSVTALGEQNIKVLPFTSVDQQLTVRLDNGGVRVDLAQGLASVTFNPVTDLYIIEMDRKLNNASFGLLGTNNLDRGDDLKLTDGSVTNSTQALQEHYELTRNRKCLVTAPSDATCEKIDYPSCLSLSNKWPHFHKCFLVLDPSPFIFHCQRDECNGRSGCKAVKAYTDACRRRGMDVSVPPVCAGCIDNSAKHAMMDIVVVQSVHRAVEAQGKVPTLGQNLIDALKHLDIRVGLVTYGDQGRGTNAVLLNGRLLERPSQLAGAQKMAFSTEELASEAAGAMRLAAEYPYRDHAKRVVVFMYQNTIFSGETIHGDLIPLFNDKNILLIAASNYDGFSQNKVFGLWSNGKVIGRSKKATAPEDPFADLVRSSRGMWLDLGVLRHGRRNKIKHVAKQLTHMSKDTGESCKL